MSELRLFGEYGLLPRLALQAMLPLRFVDTQTQFTNLAGQPITLDYESIHHRNEALVGVGDAQLLLHTGWILGNVQLSARGGVSLPFGKIQPNPFKLGDEGLPHEHLQFGTGTFNPIVALDAARPFENWTLAAFGQAQVPLYQNTYGYRAGARILAGLVAQSPLGTEESSFRLGLSTYHETAERWDGVVPTEDGNQGRTDFYVAPGMTLPLWGEWTVSIDVSARVYGQAVNAQLSMPVIVQVGLGRLFHFEEGMRESQPPRPSRGDVADAVKAGEAVVLTPVPGKWTVFDFWAPWCDACRTLGADLESMAAERAELAIRRVNIVDFGSPIARQEIPDATTLPYVRIVDPQGRIVWAGSGTAAGIRARVREMVARPSAVSVN